jgi:hypothetical protein
MLALTDADIAIGNGKKRLVATGQKSPDYLNAAARTSSTRTQTPSTSPASPRSGKPSRSKRAKRPSTTAGTGTSETKLVRLHPTLSLHPR